MARVRFHETSPDFFAVENLSPPGWQILRVAIALPGSAGRLIFDTAPGGPGRSAATAFFAHGGPVRLAAEPQVPDGAEALALDFTSFAPGQRFAFTIDMDDRVSGLAGTSVSGTEIEGAGLSVSFAQDGAAETHTGTFDAGAEAIARALCLS
ncbi:hypothetical protein LNKW23_47680 [Paralimibaculum aggregatum]|uniref:Uncharacterized protein n=1 Tax=Paralimibaculum aggregatum TaxID=3036245 RepID=A0ABQ6LTZ0_9RHOB|nr:aggregation factor core [Limibaculum sp. NKW23]GMG85545.1 hypothetical protein LNKW23_47680 [Limibaculum sp. NKW23]